MPSDSNGVYSLPGGYTAITGEVIQASQHNPPLEDLETAMSARLMRSGVAPMTGPLKASDGSVGSPSLTFNSATSSGLYKTANGIGVSIGGAKVAEFTSSGVSRMLGELIPWTRLAAPSGWVLPYGQTLSRTTYADLWGIAQTEIAAGNTFYNNGDGTTTFGIGDLRGRGVAGKDNMGGTAAGRLAVRLNGSVLGASGGGEEVTLDTSQMPSHYHTAAINDAGHVHTEIAPVVGASGATGGGNGSSLDLFTPTQTRNTSLATTGVRVSSGNGLDTVNSAGGGGAHNNVQPTMICNYILYAGA